MPTMVQAKAVRKEAARQVSHNALARFDCCCGVGIVDLERQLVMKKQDKFWQYVCVCRSLWLVLPNGDLVGWGKMESRCLGF